MSPTVTAAATSRRHFLFLIVLLALLAAFPPLVTDMYLPTLPAMQESLHTVTSMVQMGLTASMVGMALGQVFLGPLSDKYGRRPLLLASLAGFCLTTLACALAPTIEVFIAMRLLQGMGAAGGVVLSRSVAADAYSGRELLRIMAIIGAVGGIIPVAGPVAGGLVGGLIGWRGIFLVLLGIGAVILLMATRFRESLPPERRTPGGVLSAFGGYTALGRNRHFLATVLAFAFGQAMLFAYISAAPFVLQQQYGFSELQFSVTFGVNALAIGLGSALSVKARSVVGATRMGAAGATLMALTLMALMAWRPSLWAFEVSVWLMLFFVGFLFCGASTMALDAGRSHSGVAAAIVGASGFLFGGIVTPIVGFGDIALTMSIVCAGSGLPALLCLYVAPRPSLASQWDEVV